MARGSKIACQRWPCKTFTSEVWLDALPLKTCHNHQGALHSSNHGTIHMPCQCFHTLHTSQIKLQLNNHPQKTRFSDGNCICCSWVLLFLKRGSNGEEDTDDSTDHTVHEHQRCRHPRLTLQQLIALLHHRELVHQLQHRHYASEDSGAAAGSATWDFDRFFCSLDIRCVDSNDETTLTSLARTLLKCSISNIP